MDEYHILFQLHNIHLIAYIIFTEMPFSQWELRARVCACNMKEEKKTEITYCAIYMK